MAIILNPGTSSQVEDTVANSWTKIWLVCREPHTSIHCTLIITTLYTWSPSRLFQGHTCKLVWSRWASQWSPRTHCLSSSRWAAGHAWAGSGSESCQREPWSPQRSSHGTSGHGSSGHQSRRSCYMNYITVTSLDLAHIHCTSTSIGITHGLLMLRNVIGIFSSGKL